MTRTICIIVSGVATAIFQPVQGDERHVRDMFLSRLDRFGRGRTPEALWATPSTRSGGGVEIWCILVASRPHGPHFGTLWGTQTTPWRTLAVQGRAGRRKKSEK